MCLKSKKNLQDFKSLCVEGTPVLRDEEARADQGERTMESFGKALL